jgi:NNP family nitrate/nitrite transporter-like MFS transporter
VIYLVLFSLVDSRTFFFILAGGALVAFLVTLFMLQEPKGAFEAEFSHDAEGAIE